MTITITWATIKWLGIPLFLGGLIGLLAGDLPDHSGSSFGNGIRWIFWPLFMTWLVAVFCHGLM